MRAGHNTPIVLTPARTSNLPKTGSSYDSALELSSLVKAVELRLALTLLRVDLTIAKRSFGWALTWAEATPAHGAITKSVRQVVSNT
jgi:hypothetical protein